MPDRTIAPRPQADVQQAFEVLLCGFEESKGQAIDQRWLWLEAAHVMGQSGLAMHWRSHAWMLRFSFQLRDWPEAAGQFLRLALVPLGDHPILGGVQRNKVSCAHGTVGAPR
jgi:hypothetical protein